MITSLEASLRRLNTSYVDVLMPHFPDGITPAEEILAGLDDLVRAGKVRYGGLSNFPAWRVAGAVVRASLRGLAPLAGIETEYSLAERSAERELLPMAEAHGLGVLLYSPLAGGLLTGKYRRGEAPREGTRFTLGNAAQLYQQRYWKDDQLDVVAQLAAHCAARGASLTHLALRWVLDQPQVTAAIVGASKADQLRDSLGALEATLTDEDRAVFDAAWYALPRRPPAEER
jgi:aryl-alcohol dehydrogenase-like predicted oxidoreductase